MKISVESIGVIGLSHLGLVWSAVFASYGYKIIGYDVNKTNLSSLENGIVPINEPGLQDLFIKYSDHFAFSDDPDCLKNSSIIFFLHDVPYDNEGIIDLTIIDHLLNESIPHFSNCVEFVLMSQVPVGFTRNLKEQLKKYHPGNSLHLTYCLQTLTIGKSLEWFEDPDRIVLGLADSSKKISTILLSVFEHLNCMIEYVSYESAELTKEAIQLKLAASVSFINTISDLCESLGADIREVTDVIKLDKRFSPYDYWRPGLGFAGGHIERGLATLNKLSLENDISPLFIDTIVELSDKRYSWLKRIIDDHILSIKKMPRICLWGLSYKKGTESLHNAHCLKIIRDYAHLSHITVYDPLAILPGDLNIKQFSSKIDALDNSDCLIILTEWDECMIKDLSELKVMNNRVVIDCVDIVDSNVRQHELITYFGMGLYRGGIKDA